MFSKNKLKLRELQPSSSNRAAIDFKRDKELGATNNVHDSPSTKLTLGTERISQVRQIILNAYLFFVSRRMIWKGRMMKFEFIAGVSTNLFICTLKVRKTNFPFFLNNSQGKPRGVSHNVSYNEV